MKIILFLLICIPFLASAQIKEGFKEQLNQDREKQIFSLKLKKLNSLHPEKQLNIPKLDSLIKTNEFNFMKIKENKTGKYLQFDLPQYQADCYDELEKKGEINNLKRLRTAKLLSIPSRHLASEVEFPIKRNKKQSDNDFYLEYIKKFIKDHKAALGDTLTFEEYLKWEKEENLQNEIAIKDFRASFITYLLKHY